MDSSDQFPLGFSPFLRVYKDGRFERALDAEIFVPPSVEPILGVSSKDEDILPELGVSARLYLPKTTEPGFKLPILVYYHGGGFCIQTPFSPRYHSHLNSLVAKANIVAVSVRYRRAPEHPLPTAYDDAWAALQWTASHAINGGSESWLTDHGDFTRLFVAGNSSGGNMAHNVAMRAGNEELVNGVKIHGAILIQPYFWSVEASNRVEDPIGKAKMEGMWTLSCPSATGLEDPRINPMATGAPRLRGLACKRVLVCAAEKDFVKDLCWSYYQTLTSTGWEGTAEFWETEDEDHSFHLSNPGSEKAAVMMKRVADFLNH